MAFIKFRKVTLESLQTIADWLDTNAYDHNTRYTFYNTSNEIVGEYIGNKPVSKELIWDSIDGRPDITLKEDKSNKKSDFLIKNDIVYPSILATFNEIVNQINTHNLDQASHPYIINALNEIWTELNRMDARGKSYGSIDLTQSELLNGRDTAAVNSYINNYLDNEFDDYTPEMGHIVYTKVSVTENVYEWEFNGDDWVNNGAETVIRASDLAYGIIKGDGEYLTILNGIATVLKSNYAERLGTSGASITYSALNTMLNNIFSKFDEIDPNVLFQDNNNKVSLVLDNGYLAVKYKEEQ